MKVKIIEVELSLCVRERRREI